MTLKIICLQKQFEKIAKELLNLSCQLSYPVSLQGMAASLSFLAVFEAKICQP